MSGLPLSVADPIPNGCPLNSMTPISTNGTGQLCFVRTSFFGPLSCFRAKLSHRIFILLYLQFHKSL
jgi:hypothetical protein